MAEQTIRWGIAGTGAMAEVFTSDFPHVEGSEPVAVGSRDRARAEAFAHKHGVARAHGSYAALCADPEVDVVYVATPHPQHLAIAREAIGNGKAVVVEKSMTATLAGTQELVGLAREAGTFCMEAMWTRFHPAVRKLHEIVDGGQLGRLRSIQGELFARREFDPASRLFAKDLGGGALLDLGVDAVVEQRADGAQLVGDAEEVVREGERVDAQVALSLRYGAHAVASLGCSLQAEGKNGMTVAGEKGNVVIGHPFHHAWHLYVDRRGVRPVEWELPTTGHGYVHEIEHVAQCLRDGRTESDVMPLQASLEVAGMLHDALTQLGVSYDEDDRLS